MNRLTPAVLALSATLAACIHQASRLTPQSLSQPCAHGGFLEVINHSPAPIDVFWIPGDASPTAPVPSAFTGLPLGRASASGITRLPLPGAGRPVFRYGPSAIAVLGSPYVYQARYMCDNGA